MNSNINVTQYFEWLIIKTFESQKWNAFKEFEKRKAGMKSRHDLNEDLPYPSLFSRALHVTGPYFSAGILIYIIWKSFHDFLSLFIWCTPLYVVWNSNMCCRHLLRHSFLLSQYTYKYSGWKVCIKKKISVNNSERIDILKYIWA